VSYLRRAGAPCACSRTFRRRELRSPRADSRGPPPHAVCVAGGGDLAMCLALGGSYVTFLSRAWPPCRRPRRRARTQSRHHAALLGQPAAPFLAPHLPHVLHAEGIATAPSPPSPPARTPASRRAPGRAAAALRVLLRPAPCHVLFIAPVSAPPLEPLRDAPSCSPRQREPVPARNAQRGGLPVAVLWGLSRLAVLRMVLLAPIAMRPENRAAIKPGS
jgi:hypothetical protein